MSERLIDLVYCLPLNFSMPTACFTFLVAAMHIPDIMKASTSTCNPSSCVYLKILSGDEEGHSVVNLLVFSFVD